MYVTLHVHVHTFNVIFISRFAVNCLAVQEERQRTKDKNENEVESTSNSHHDMPIERVLEAELRVEPKNDQVNVLYS